MSKLSETKNAKRTHHPQTPPKEAPLKRAKGDTKPHDVNKLFNWKEIVRLAIIENRKAIVLALKVQNISRELDMKNDYDPQESTRKSHKLGERAIPMAVTFNRLFNEDTYKMLLEPSPALEKVIKQNGDAWKHQSHKLFYSCQGEKQHANDICNAVCDKIRFICEYHITDNPLTVVVSHALSADIVDYIKELFKVVNKPDVAAKLIFVISKADYAPDSNIPTFLIFENRGKEVDELIASGAYEEVK